MDNNHLITFLFLQSKKIQAQSHSKFHPHLAVEVERCVRLDLNIDRIASTIKLYAMNEKVASVQYQGQQPS